jgi:hypothetical protein
VARVDVDTGKVEALARQPAALQAKARAANRRVLDVQQAGQDCAIGPSLFERIVSWIWWRLA